MLGSGNPPGYPIIQSLVRNQIGVQWIDSLLSYVPEFLVVSEFHAETHQVPQASSIEGVLG